MTLHNLCRLGGCVLCAASVLAAIPAAAEEATGVVYHDRNNNATLDEGEEGIAGVGVSNGREVVETGSDGRYTLPVEGDAVLFVIKPTDWRTRIGKDNLPHFYYNHKPSGSPTSGFEGVAPTGPLPESVDFPLYPQQEPREFRAIIFGDTQPRNIEEVQYIAHDVVEELIGADVAFGVTLGDVVFNDLSVFEPLNGVIGTIGCPWYNVLGNHDTNMDTVDDMLSDETFERIYGPNYYSYNYGGVHFVVLDDVQWTGEGYHGGLGERQLAFVKNDLAHVPEDTLAVYMMHIPLPEARDREEFLALLEGRPNTTSLSAHTHRMHHEPMGPEEGWHGEGQHRHLVHGTACGSWWSGHPDEYGIPHTMMGDGTPNGYSIATFNGKDYSLRYKAARYPEDFQMHIHAPEAASTADASSAEVLVNVFLGAKENPVEMRVGEEGGWLPMTHQVRPDPYFQKLKEREEKQPKVDGRELPGLRESSHIWSANLPEGLQPGTHVIHIRATDNFGNRHTGKRIIRIEG